jgi:hypothetical protein
VVKRFGFRPWIGLNQSELCKECVIRNSVKAAISGGVTHRETHKVELLRQGKTVVIDLLVTATPLPDAAAPRVLLLLEDNPLPSARICCRSNLPACHGKAVFASMLRERQARGSGRRGHDRLAFLA